MPMKNSIPFHSLWILLIVVSCSSEQATKSEIIQYQMPLVDEMEEVQKEAALVPKPIKVALKNAPPPPPDESLEIEYDAYPEPPPPPPEPEPIVWVPQKTMGDKWQEIMNLPKDQIRWHHWEFCFNYGDTLVKQERYEEALELFEEAKELNPRMGEVYFNIAKIYALQGKSNYEISDCLEKARFRCKNYKGLLYDDAFENYRKWDRFFYSYKNLFKGNKRAMFEGFIAFAPKKNLTEAYELNPKILFEDIGARRANYLDYNKQHPVIYNYFKAFASEADYNSFSRGGHDNCRYEMCLAKTENYFAVIYSVEKSWSEYILPKKYYLVTYTLSGNKISKLEIANRGSFKTCKGFVLYPDKSLVVTDYKVKWKMGAKKTWENKNFMNYKQLKKTPVISSKTYQIIDKGRLVDTDGLFMFNDL